MANQKDYEREKNGRRFELKGGMNTIKSPDLLSPGEYPYLQNVRSYLQDRIIGRNTQSAQMVTADSSIQSIARMNDTTPIGPTSGYVLISSSVSGNVYAGNSSVASGLSGNPLSIIPFRPNTSVQPWAYMADSSQSAVLTTKYAINDSSATFSCFGQMKMRSDGRIYKTGIQEPPLAPTVSSGNTSVTSSGTLLATAIPWTNYNGQNPNYNYGETYGLPNPGSPNPVDGTGPFIVNVSNASTLTITALSGTATINGGSKTPASLGPSTASSTNPGHYIQIAGSGGTPATATVVVGAFTDGAGNVIPAGVSPLFVPSVVDVGSSFSGSVTIQVPYGAKSLQIGINSTGNTFSSNSGSFSISVKVTTNALPSVLSTLGTLTLSYWGDSPQSGSVAAYIWKNPNDQGGGTSRSTSNAVGTITGNSFIFDATFAAGIPGLPGLGSPSIPMQWSSLSPASAVIGSAPVFPSPIKATYPSQNGYQDFNFCLYGQIYVPAAGNYTFVLTNHDDCIWGIQGATLVSSTTSGSGEGGSASISGSGQTITVAKGYPLLPRQNYTHGDGGHYAQTTVVVSFTAAGIYGIEVDYDYWYHSGRILLLEASPTPAASPTIIPPLTQGVRNGVSYAGKYRSSLTGAQSNPSPTTTPQTTPTLASQVSIPYSTDPQVDKCDFYRQDAGLPNFTYVATGPNTNPPTAITDALSDLAASTNPQMTYDDFEPVPSIDIPRKGIVNVSSGIITWVSGDTFNTRWLPGTTILIGSTTQLPYVFISRPTSTTQVVVPGVPDGSGLTYNIYEPILANQPLPSMWGPTDNTAYMFACGDYLRPGTLYFSKGNSPDSWPDTNQIEVCSPSEQLLNGYIIGGIGQVFSTERAWWIYPTFTTALATVSGVSGQPFNLIESVNDRGLYIRNCICTEAGKNGFFRAKDGIYISPSGQGSRSITDSIYNLFPHEQASGTSVPGPVQVGPYTIYPPDDTNPEVQKLSFAYGYLYYDYQDVNGNPRTLVYDVVAKGWSVDVGSPAFTCHAPVVGKSNGTYTGCVDGSITVLGGSAPPLPAFVQGASSSAYVSSAALAFPSANNAGNCLVVVGFKASFLAFNPTIADTQGNIYTLVSHDASNWGMSVWVAPNCKAGANTVTITGGDSSEGGAIQIHEYSGVATVSPLDVQTTVSGGAVNPIPLNITTTTVNDLLFSALAGGALGGALPTASGYTVRESQQSGVPWEISTADAAGGSNGAKSISWVNSFSGTHVASFLSLKPGRGSESVSSVVATHAENAGDSRAFKKLGDVFLKAVIQNGSPIGVSLYSNQYGTSLSGYSPTQLTGTGLLGPYIVNDSSGNGIDLIDAEMILSWPTSSSNYIELWQPDFIQLPESTQDRPTDWGDAGSHGNKLFRGVLLEMDTLGVSKSFSVQRAENQQLFVPNESPVTVTGQTLKAFTFTPPFVSHSVRVFSTDGVSWRVWGQKWIVDPWVEYATLESAWSDLGTQGAKYLRGLVLPMDTQGLSASFKVVTSDGGSVTFTATTPAAVKTVSSFAFNPPIIAHDVQIQCLTATAGAWVAEARWDFDPYPELISEYTSIMELHGPDNKFMQGVKLIADTGNLPVTFQVLYDGGQTGPTFTGTFNGKQTKTFTWTPFTAHDIQLVPQSSARVWWGSIGQGQSEWVFQPFPESATLWQTELTDLGGAGWQHVGYLNFEYISTQTITLVFTVDTGNGSIAPATITIPSSGGTQTKFETKVSPNKWKLLGFTATSSAVFTIFKEGFEVWLRNWGSNGPYRRSRPYGGPSSSGAIL